jgi:hypothetical protein
MGDNSPWGGNQDNGEQKTVVGGDNQASQDPWGNQGGYQPTEVEDDFSFQPTYPQQNPTPPPSPSPWGQQQPQQQQPQPQQQQWGGQQQGQGWGNQQPSPQQWGNQQPPPQWGPSQPQPQPAKSGSSGPSTVMMLAPEEKPLAWFAVVDGPPDLPRGTVFNLGREIFVGRTEGEIVIAQDRAASSRHLKIRMEPNENDPNLDAFVLYDQASANGTYVSADYEQCKQAQNRVYRHVLTDGDFILVGQTIFVFKQVCL